MPIPTIVSSTALRLALVIAAMIPVVVLQAPVAHAGVATCTGTAQDPVFPNYDSSQELASYTNSTAGEVIIRRGYYCVPVLPEGQPIGFGLDKVQNRHYIGRPQDLYSEADAIRAVKFALSAPSPTSKTDGWGFGWNFVVYAVGGTGCPPNQPESACAHAEQLPVRAASTEGGAATDPQAGMPVGDPLGLQTVYCDYGDPTQLRCPLWVTSALIRGAKGQGIN